MAVNIKQTNETLTSSTRPKPPTPRVLIIERSLKFTLANSSCSAFVRLKKNHFKSCTCTKLKIVTIYTILYYFIAWFWLIWLVFWSLIITIYDKFLLMHGWCFLKIMCINIYIMHLLLNITNNIYTKLLLETLQNSQSELPLVLCIKSIQLILCDLDILHKVD